MSVTQVKTAGIADDAVTLAKQAAGTDGQVITYDASGNPTAVGPGSDGQVLTSTGAGSPPAFENLPASNNYTHPNHSGDVTSSGDGATTIADNAVTLAKMAHGTDGQIITYDASGAPTAVGPGTDGQVLTSTGAGSPPAFEAIPASGTPNNLIINGACAIAQRGSSSTSTGYKTVDRFKIDTGGTDEAVTQAQHGLTSSDTGPWEKGFRSSIHLTNGNQTSGAGAADWVELDYSIEAQDLANSGWDYTETSSNITLSFWAQASVAQTYYVYLQTVDGTAQLYTFSFALSANTWAKVTKTIPGAANITFDNNNALGLRIGIVPFYGTDYTTSGFTLNTWAAHGSGNQMPDMTSTWYTTNDSTFEITGLQLEVSDTAGEFEHRSYGEELARCQRYFEKEVFGPAGGGYYGAASGVGTKYNGVWKFAVTKRAQPAMTPKGNVLNSSNGSGSCTLFTGLHGSQLYNQNATWYWQGSDGDDIFWADAEI